jgi:hypothetical protein
MASETTTRGPNAEPSPTSPMTEDERQYARALGRCRFPVGVNTKRFAARMAFLAERPDGAITAAQGRFLRQAVLRYRRQIDSALVARAREQLFGEA